MKRLVLDATTLASGIAGLRHRGPSAQLVAALIAGSFEAVLCPTLLEELGRALRKPYFRERISEQQVRAALEGLTTLSVLLEDPSDPPRVLRDPTDDYLIALATTAGAEAIVTGDKDLLEHPDLRPPALTPREAVKQLGL